MVVELRKRIKPNTILYYFRHTLKKILWKVPGWLAAWLAGWPAGFSSWCQKGFPIVLTCHLCEFLFQLCTTMEKMHGVAITRAMSVTQHMAGLEQTTLGLKSCQ